MNLEKRGDYMLLYYQRCRFRFKCSCSIAFLRNVEPQGSADYKATGWFCALKRLFLLMSHLVACSAMGYTIPRHLSGIQSVNFSNKISSYSPFSV